MSSLRTAGCDGIRGPVAAARTQANAPPVTMRRLFDFGLEKAQDNDIWINAPPGLSQ